MDRPCSQCGGKLVGVAFERTVVCAYCQTPQPNVDCMAVGQEVIFDDGFARRLATVVACRGPDEIDVTGPKTLKLEDLTPVTQPAETLESGTLVYVKSTIGWERTWTDSAVRYGALKVKHPGPSFQDDFFNREVNLNAVRVPAKETERHRRSAGEALLDEARGDPIGTGFGLLFKAVFLVVGLGFAAFAATVIYGVIKG